jgi:hypothetical protein
VGIYYILIIRPLLLYHQNKAVLLTFTGSDECAEQGIALVFKNNIDQWIFPVAMTEKNDHPPADWNSAGQLPPGTNGPRSVGNYTRKIFHTAYSKQSTSRALFDSGCNTKIPLLTKD